MPTTSNGVWILKVREQVLAALVFISIFTLWFASSVQAHQHDDLKQAFDIWYIDDTDNPLTLEQVKVLPDNLFARVNQQIPQPETLDFSLWYKITLKDKTQPVDQPISILMDNPTLNLIEFYHLGRGQVINAKVIGDTQRSDSVLDYVVPQINLFDGFLPMDTLYIKVKTNGASASPIIIDYAKESELRNSAQLMLLGSFLGVVMIMMIYNFFMFRGIGDPSYLNYIGYIFFAGMTVSLINGFTFYIFPTEVAIWMHNHMLISHFCGLAFALRFAISFLRFDSIKPWFVNLGNWSSRVCFAIAASALVLDEATLTPIYFVCVGLIYLYAILLMSQVYKYKLIWVKYYLASWVPLFIGVGVGIAAFNSAVEYNFLTRNAALIGILSEICIMAIALMDRFRANELDKDYRANHDAVTGLPNRTSLFTVIDSLTYSKKPFSLALFEIPEAKELLPKLGIVTANLFFKELFKNISKYTVGLEQVYRFKNNIQNRSHHIIRISDARFAVVFVGDMNKSLLSYNMLTIREAVSTIMTVNGASISVSSYGGVVCYPKNSDSKDHLLFLANQALHAGMKSEEGWSRYKNAEDTKQLSEQFKLAGLIQKAISNDDLQLYHQPQVDLNTGQVVGSELLLRWNHNEMGYISPEKIVQAAEQTGIVHQLTEWVINKGFSQHAKLLKLGFNHHVSINISAHDLNDNGLIANILTATMEHKVPESSVIIEITESATANNPELACRTVMELHEQGYKVAIDDYGTGYSNLKYISQLPLYSLKVDKSFMNIDVSARNRTIVEMTINMAHKLGIEVVAEGVENKEIEDLLKAFNCPITQGFYYAKPMAFLDYMRWLQNKPKKVESRALVV